MRYLVIPLILISCLPIMAAPLHQGNGVDSFIPGGFNSYRDFRYLLNRSADIQLKYKRIFDGTYNRLGISTWEYWCTEKDWCGKEALTVYCIKPNGCIYKTSQDVPKGTPVMGYCDETGVRRILMLADCGNPTTRCLPNPYCKSEPPPAEQKKPCVEEGNIPSPRQAAAPPPCEEPLIPLPNGTPPGLARGASQIRTGENGFFGSVVTGSVFIPTKVPETNIAMSQAQATGDVNQTTGGINVENNANQSTSVAVNNGNTICVP